MAPKRRIDDEEFVAAVIDAIEKGASPEVALRAHGVSVSSFYEWKGKAKAGDEKFQAFLNLVDQAEAHSELEDIFSTQVAAQRAKNSTFKCPECKKPIDAKRLKGFESMQKVFSEAAKIAIERLSRRFPKRWAAVSRIQVEDEQKDFLDALEGLLAPEVYRVVLEAYVAAASGVEAPKPTEGAGLH